MSAASNVTGIMTDTEAVAELTHKYGGLSFWDYAAGGNIDVLTLSVRGPSLYLRIWRL